MLATVENKIEDLFEQRQNFANGQNDLKNQLKSINTPEILSNKNRTIYTH